MAKKKIPFIVNMSCGGKVQCPLCEAFYSLSLFVPQDCSSDYFECPACHQMIGVDKDTVQMSDEIESKRRDIDVIKRIQYHLDTPVCRILSGIKTHLTTIGIKELSFLYWNLGGESIDELAEIIRGLIHLRRKHKRPLKAV